MMVEEQCMVKVPTMYCDGGGTVCGSGRYEEHCNGVESNSGGEDCNVHSCGVHSKSY